MTIAPKEEPLIHEDSKKTFQSTFQTFGKKTKKKKNTNKRRKASRTGAGEKRYRGKSRSRKCIGKNDEGIAPWTNNNSGNNGCTEATLPHSRIFIRILPGIMQALRAAAAAPSLFACILLASSNGFRGKILANRNLWNDDTGIPE